jgi:hypothetical protein
MYSGEGKIKFLFLKKKYISCIGGTLQIRLQHNNEALKLNKETYSNTTLHI